MADAIKYATTPVGDIAYVERGQGPTALFIHGVFLNHYFWRHVIDRVSDVRRCIAIDLLAHGATRTAADQDVSFAAQAEMIEAMCESLGLGPVDVVANDSGGGIAQILAAHHPDRIRSLVLTNCDVHDNWPPPAFQRAVAAAKAGAFGPIGQKMLADVDFARATFAVSYERPHHVSAETFQTYLAPIFSTPEGTRNLERFIASMDCRQTTAVEPQLRRLAAPTLIVWAKDDVFFPVSWAYWMRDTIPGARRVIELDGARLFFPEERPDELADALREFWNEEPAHAGLRAVAAADPSSRKTA